MHPNHKLLFEPVKIGPVIARNRFYQVPHGVGAGYLQDVEKGVRGVRAEGGWGVVCCGICSIHPSSDFNYAGIGRLWSDRHISENAVTVEEIHKHGALAGIELGHYGLAACNYVTKQPYWSPSRQFARYASSAFPTQAEAIDKKTIQELLSWQKAAALRAKKAGYDIVYVYAAHDLALPMQFLSPRHNQRTDEYGGSIDNRARLLREMIEVTRDAVGETCAVAVRLSVDELSGLDGITADREGRQVIESLGEIPDLWDVNVSDWANDSRSSRFGKEGWQEPYVRFVKSVTSKPVVGVGRFTSPDAMASQVRRGILDLIGAARPSIADPFLPRKIEEGRPEDIRECIGCNYCVKTANHGVVPGCTQNPTMGEEWRSGWHPELIQPSASGARILVVGGGPAGLEAARALAQRGYQVSLAEASPELGGRVRRESRLPGLAEWIRVAEWRIGQITKNPKVAVFKGNRLSAGEILELEHEHVVLATGSTWTRDGLGQSNRTPIQIDPNAAVFTPDDLMAGRRPTRGPVLLFDDDQYYLGSVLAELLSENGLAVRLVTPGPTVSRYTEASLEHQHLLQRLRQLHDSLYRDLTLNMDRVGGSGIRSITVIGDARVPDTIAAAVFNGHRYAREFECQPQGSLASPVSNQMLS